MRLCRQTVGKRVFSTLFVAAATCLFFENVAICQAVPDDELRRPVSRTEYQEACRRIADELLERTFQDPDDWVTRQRKLEAISHAALVQAKLWTWTGEAKYSKGANRFLLAVARRRQFIREADFFTVYPFAKTCEILRANNQLDDVVAREAQAFIFERFRARDVSDHNQALTRACGLAIAARMFPAAPRASEWQDYAEAVWEYWTRVGDITENAPNYNRIDSVYLFLLADLLDRVDEMRSPSVEAMFRRWRDQVAPSGTIPAYGDSGSGPLKPAADWPRVNAWGQWVAGFERAAAFYDDETFQWAAQRIFRRGMRSEPLGRRYFHVIALSALMRAPDWMRHPIRPADLPLKPPPAGPFLQTRRDTKSTTAWDKLILAPARTSGAPFVLCDLYARGHHGHVNQHGGVNWFEFDNVPLVASLGYNNREPHHTNALVIQPDDGQPFPHRRRFPSDTWMTAELPTNRLPSPPDNADLRTLTDLGLRVASRYGVTLWVDNLRLAGPAPTPLAASPQKTQLLEGFESPEGWNFSPHRTGQSQEGSYGLVWQFPPGAHTATNPNIVKRLRDVRFSPQTYPRLLIDWRVSHNEEAARPFILRVGTDYHAHVQQLEPQLLDVRVSATAAGDQLGSLEFVDWYARGVRHHRQLLLTREGVLIAIDRVHSSAPAVGRLAGPVWHLGPRDMPRQLDDHPNCFQVNGTRQALLLHFSKPKSGSRVFGVQSADVWSIAGQKTAFTHERLTDAPCTFVSTLIPFQNAQHGTAEAIAASVRVSHSTTSTDVQLNIPRGRDVRLKIKVESSGKFRVDRH